MDLVQHCLLTGADQMCQWGAHKHNPKARATLPTCASRQLVFRSIAASDSGGLVAIDGLLLLLP